MQTVPNMINDNLTIVATSNKVNNVAWPILQFFQKQKAFSNYDKF